MAEDETHIRILQVDARDTLHESVLLLILIRDNRICIDVPVVDFEATFVGNPVAIPEGGGRRMVRAGHVMEGGRGLIMKNKMKEKGWLGGMSLSSSLLAALSSFRGLRVGFGPKSGSGRQKSAQCSKRAVCT